MNNTSQKSRKTTLTFFLCFIIGYAAQINAQNYLNEQQVWRIRKPYYDYPFTGHILAEVRVEGDSIVDGISYKILNQSGTVMRSDNQEFAYSKRLFGLLRADDKKIYYYNDIDASEHLLFDFGLEVGDSIHQDYCPSVVSSIDSIYMGSKVLKRWQFSSIGASPAHAMVTEGIGTWAGLMGAKCMMNSPGSDELLCFEEAGALLVFNQSYAQNCSDFSYNNSPEIDQKERIRAYPNPFSNVLYIELDIPYTACIDLTDAAGRKIFSFASTSSHWIEIPTKHLEKGLYLLRMRHEDYHKTVKLIKI